VRLIGQCLSLEFSDDHINEIADYFCSLIFSVPPAEIAEIKSLLPGLAGEFPLGLISDTGYITGHYIRKFLQQENLLQYFSSFMFSDEQENSKPHRSVFEKTAANLNIPLGRLIHIGDLERTDITGARQAGCYCIKYTGAYKPAAQDNTQAHYIIDNYLDLPPVLNRLITECGADEDNSES
jgi:HAD superfamily hydrolase (TIGR01549 family)